MAALCIQSRPPSCLLGRDACLLDSDELEGASPKWVGEQTKLSHPPRRALRWLVRRINGLNSNRKQELPLPSGGSWDSLADLEQQQQQHLAPTLLPQPGQQQQQQQQQEAQEEAQNEQQQQQQQPSEQPRWRRAVRALLRPLVHALRSLTYMDPGANDTTVAERVTNVVTSLPFFVLGLTGLRRRKCPKGRHFCWAFMAVGAVASVYHGVGVSSPIRPLMRKMDYYTIAYTSNVLRRAAHIPLPRGLLLLSALVAPWKPTAVTALNLGLVESKFVTQALAHAHLMPSLKLHFGTAVAGLACFAFEDVATGVGWPPVLHSLWHCFSAVAMACSHSLLAHLEMVLLVEGVQVKGL